jgi:hypothetical protein
MIPKTRRPAGDKPEHAGKTTIEAKESGNYEKIATNE